MSRVPPARIAMVGGGLGGLTLARIVQMHGVEAVLYEAETTLDARAQGGTLDLHPESGQYAIRAAGLDRAFRAIARPEGQDLKIVDKTGAVHFAEIAEESDGDRPEADRGALRAVLLDAIDPATIRWGHRPSRATPLGDGRHRLHFANGVTETHDLLIGADGDLTAALGAYEKTMTERAAAHAEESARNLDLCIAPDGARLMAAQAARYAQRPPGGATSSSARTDRTPVPTPLSESLNPES
ncbi:FAD-dependent oxidoreductase [Streptomyces sp. NPDC101227]|uniref:FAD-dependent oxidoreductase n=1 Tax=Streptomyces sp. NPDC101227 TaxID=3366136 RepID=UPI003825D4F5